MTDKLAAFISPSKSLSSAVENVQIAERLGYDSAFATHIAGRDGLMTLAAYAAGTTTIKLGTGVLPAFPRHPVSLGVEAATLDELTGGRLILGVGTSHKITMENWYGFDMAKPLSQLKEYVSILRSLFTTGRAEHHGAFYNTNFAFMNYAARPDLPIYISGLSKNTLQFAGAAADGLILWSCMPAYIREVVVPNVRAGAEAAGRDPSACTIVAAVPSVVTDDVEGARDNFRKEFFVYMTLPFYRAAIAGAGYQDELDAFDKALGAGDMAGARDAISERMLGEFAGIGVDVPAVGVAGNVEATLTAAIGG